MRERDRFKRAAAKRKPKAEDSEPSSGIPHVEQKDPSGEIIIDLSFESLMTEKAGLYCFLS
jgi:hypothetical protein